MQWINKIWVKWEQKWENMHIRMRTWEWNGRNRDERRIKWKKKNEIKWELDIDKH